MNVVRVWWERTKKCWRRMALPAWTLGAGQIRAQCLSRFVVPVKRLFYEQQSYRSCRAGLSSRHEQVLKVTAKYSSSSQVTRVLDIGCLDGTFPMTLSRHLGANEVCGVDISQANIKNAQAKGCNAIVFDYLCGLS